MAVKKTIRPSDLEELKDHLKNTSKELVKCYNLSQLSLMDGIDTRTVKTSPKYIPVRVDTAQTKNNYLNGSQKRPYSIMYIRLDELKFIFNKRSKKKLVVEKI